MMRTASKDGQTSDREITSHAFIFDADGVVIEPWGFARALEAEYGISPDVTKEFFGGPFKQCLSGDADLVESVAPYLDRWHWPGTVQAFVDFWMESDNKPDAEVLGHIQELRKRGAKCYIASDQEQTRAEYIRVRMGFEAMFERLFFSCELGCTKLDRRFFDRIAAEIGVEHHNIHFWDDSGSYVQVARSAGWNAHIYESVESIQFALQM